MKHRRIEQLKAFIEQDPNDPFPRYALALELDAGGDTAGAISLLEDLLSRAPRYVATYQQLGTLYQKEGATAKAKAILRAGITTARQEGDLHAAGEMTEALDELGS
ncbi:MAG: tetratricopeptide repeat protein [Bacteroidetes bacterium]|jgi:Tfp pilus assembly protein PilF|nr:tetratricopeptide repeat protein [Bacteroidota bacterium]